MQFQELLDKEHSDGAKQMLDLVTRMISDGMEDDVMRLRDDEDFYQTMLKKYNL